MDTHFALPQETDDPDLVVRDARSCKDWLAKLPLLNVEISHTELTQALQRLNRQRMPAKERLKVLELLREPVSLVQEQMARRYLARPVPLAADLQHQERRGELLWRELVIGYRRVLASAMEGDAGAAEHGSFAAQRILHHLRDWFGHYALTFRPAPVGFWSEVHTLYGEVDGKGWADKRSKDGLLPSDVPYITPEGEYARLVLLGLSNPSQLLVRQYQFVDQLLARWSGRAKVVPSAPEGKLLPLALPLDDLPAMPGVVSGAPRFLERDALVGGLGKRIKQLRDAGPLETLDLGEGLVAAGGISLLTHLYRQWSERGERAYPRRATEEAVMIGGSWDRIYSQLTGTLIELQVPDKKPKELRASNMADFMLFGRRSEETFREGADRTLQLPQLSVADLLDESASGLRLTLEDPLESWQQHQLVLVRRARAPDAVGIVRRLVWLENSGVELGVQLVPGVPKAHPARQTGVNAFSDSAFPLLWLPDVPGVMQAESMVMPNGQFQPDRVLEVLMPEGPRRLRMGELLERGSGFDRCRFTWL